MEVILRPEPATDAVLSVDCVGFRFAKCSEGSDISDRVVENREIYPSVDIQFQLMNPAILVPTCMDAVG